MPGPAGGGPDRSEIEAVNYNSICVVSFTFVSIVASASTRAYLPDMLEAEALAVMSALSQPTRLRVFTLLASRSDGMASGDIADAVGVPRNLMSAHLAVLSKAGLLASTKSGREVRYWVDAHVLGELNGFLAALEASCQRVCTPSR